MEETHGGKRVVLLVAVSFFLGFCSTKKERNSARQMGGFRGENEKVIYSLSKEWAFLLFSIFGLTGIIAHW